MKYFVLLALTAHLSFGQVASKQGQGFFNWGYNRSFYAKSDIRFLGPGYDFTLYDVAANDRPTGWDSKIYLSPSNLTIPQFNCHFGVYLRDDLSISGGWDHMKYVVQEGQNVKIDGYIDREVSPDYAGFYPEGSMIEYQKDFLHLEHTDGLNLIRVNIDKYNELMSFKFLRVRSFYGAGVGVMMPQTDFTFGGVRKNNNDQVVLQGFGISTNMGLIFEIGNHFYLQAQSHQGFITLPWDRTRGKASDRVKQEIWFQEYFVSFGATFPVGLKKLEGRSSAE